MTKRILAAFLFLVSAAMLPAAKNLEIYAIDVEGGQATLFVAPGGESFLVDAGWTGNNHRDAERIVAAAKKAGVKKIDYLLITHYHSDHVGGVYQLAEKMPIANFIDHGAQTETGKDAEILFNEYTAIRSKGNHIEAKPGDTLPLKNLNVKILASAGVVLSSPLPGAGEPNPACAGFTRPAPDPSENGRSLAMLITFGDFRMLDMGDLSDDHEFDLVCPDNRIGTVDLFLMAHHGGAHANSVPFVHAIAPRVAIMNNGPHKGGDPKAWQTVRDTRTLIDLWQLHYAIDDDKQHNSPDTFIANLDADCQGNWIKVTAEKDGNFTVVNARNKFEKTYTKR